MHKSLSLTACLALLVGLAFSPQNASAESATVGQPAPAFTLIGADGKDHSPAEYKGKYIVLEWTNPDCPFVHKFYDGGDMQKLQKEETSQGVIWLRINSSAPGREGHQTAADIEAYVKKNKVAATQTLIDSDGKVGHAYGAKTTPHMFVINPEGVLIYAGGIDNKPSADATEIKGATNYVKAALEEARAGKPVAVATARPYGCSVKYAK